MLSTRCRDRLSHREFSRVVEQAGQQYGVALRFVSYNAHVSGDLARVTYTYATAPEINQASEPWAR